MLAGMLVATMLASAPPMLPPTPWFRVYSMAEEMPLTRAYGVVQDREGYLWMGVGDGLTRFDGHDFRVWQHRVDDPDSIGGNDTSALLLDSRNRLWVGGESSGLNRYEPEIDGFRHWRHGDDPASLGNNDLTAVVEGEDGRIWVGTYGAGVDHLLADESGFEHLRHDADDPTSLISDNVLSLALDQHGRLWIGTDAGLDMLDRDGHLEHVRFAGEDGPLYVWDIKLDGDRVRVATGSGLFFVDADRIARRWPADSPRRSVYSSLRTAEGDLWVGMRDELWLYPATGEATVFRPQPLLAGGFPGGTVTGMTSDAEGGMWIALNGRGIAYLVPGWPAFSRIGHVPEDPDSLAVRNVSALAEASDGQLFAGGGMALDRFDPVSGVVEHVTMLAGTRGSAIQSLLDDGKYLWIGTERELRRYANGRSVEVHDPRLRSGARHMVVYDEHHILVTTPSEGALLVDGESLEVTAVDSGSTAAGAGETSQLARIGDGIWRSNVLGLWRLATDGTRFERVEGVAPGWVRAFARRDDMLWLARSDAIESYRMEGDRAVQLSRVDSAAGWPEITVNRIAVDGLGRVWMTGRTGLWRFDPVDGRFRRFTIEDGLPSMEFSSALLARKDGTLYAGTANGIVAFHGDAPFAPPPPPRLLLAGATVRRAGRVVPLRHDGGQLEIGWNDRDLAVTALALSYVNPSRLRYRFRMDEFDSDWVDMGGNGKREFAGLGPGSYRLRIAAAGAGGSWTELPALAVRVALPPWQQPWAWASYAVLLFALAGLAWRVAQRRVERRVQLGLLVRRRELAEQASAAKTRFLATLGHEIRTPMTGVLGMAELLTHTELDASQRGMVDTIQRSGSVLLKLVNDALDLARIEAGRMDIVAAPMDPSALLHEVVALESGVARGKGLGLRASVAADVPRRVLGDAVRVRQILLNLVNNALKFGDHGEVRVSLELRDGALCYQVSDNGPGMDEALRRRLFHRFEQGESGSSSGGSGLGLAICRELVTLMEGRIEVDSEPDRGSTFRVFLPLTVTNVADAGSKRSTPETASSLHVLVVEDDATVAAVMVGLLENQGHAVRHAADALAALSEFENRPFDAVLVDLDLPDVDGFELIAMLRARPGGERVRLIVVTARTARDDEDRARAAGAHDFLRKPVNGQQLAMALADAVRVRSAAAAPRDDEAQESPDRKTTGDA